MAVYPTPKQWELFDLYINAPPPMTPLEFLQYWDLDYPALARITRTSRSTVEHWFSRGNGHRPPASQHCRRLAIVHFLWSNMDAIPPGLLRRWQQGR